METSVARLTAVVETSPLTDRLEIYKVLHETQRYEGDGIWSRFNILVSVNVIFFGAVAYILSSPPHSASALVVVVACAGSLMNLWALYVLHRLWLWHVHWKEMLREVEETFPPYLARPLKNRPKVLQKGDAWYQAWLLAYTQPFLLILLILWIAIGALVGSGVVAPSVSSRSRSDPPLTTTSVSPSPAPSSTPSTAAPPSSLPL